MFNIKSKVSNIVGGKLEECVKCLKKKPGAEMAKKGICKFCDNKQKSKVAAKPLNTKK